MSTLELKELSAPAGEVIKIAAGKTLDLKSQGTTTLPTGSVLQVVSHLDTAQTTQTLSTSDTVVGNMEKAITPKGTNSKFLVYVRWLGEVGNAHDCVFNIQMNTTRVNINGQGSRHGLTVPVTSFDDGNNDDSTPESANFQTLVSTSSVIGTAITFAFVAESNYSAPFATNRTIGGGGQERGTSEIIITEIAG